MTDRIDLERIVKAPFVIDHESVLEAVLADLADLVPVVGDIAGLVRVLEALERKDDLRLALELGDLVGGLPPAIGEVVDALTPTNLIIYLIRKK